MKTTLLILLISTLIGLSYYTLLREPVERAVAE